MRTPLLSILLLAAACGDDSSSLQADAGGSGSNTGDGGGSASCPRTPAPADRIRHVVVAHPYSFDGDPSPAFEVLELSTTGTLTRFEPPRTFNLGHRMPFGEITFTPDGQIGIAPLDNGTLGVFRLSEGVVTVIHPAFDGAFYADHVVMDPSGERAYVTDRNTRENGGGIYEIAIGCDGTLTDLGLVAAAKSPGGMALVGSKVVIAAREILDSPTTGTDVHVVDLSGTPAVLGSSDAFGDDDQIFSGFALAEDGKTAFIGDSNVVGSNRIGIVDVDLATNTITANAVIADITDPSGIVASTFGDVVIVTSSQPPEEGIYVLDKLGTGGAWRNRGELTYVGAASQLPGDMAAITRGSLDGRVFVSELSTIRQLRFDAGGDVIDTSRIDFGEDLDDICGAIGVTP